LRGDLLLGGLRQMLRLLPARNGRSLSALEPKARKAIARVIRCAMDNAPWMFPEVIGPLIIMQIRQVELLKQGRPLSLNQIGIESSPGYELKPAVPSFVIPDAFAAAYKKVFPDIFTRVQGTLNNKARVEEVLIGIFTQFVERWGVQLEQLESYHIEDLEAM